eukprot:jgi/Mesen1/6536/ME000334S05881
MAVLPALVHVHTGTPLQSLRSPFSGQGLGGSTPRTARQVSFSVQQRPRLSISNRITLPDEDQACEVEGGKASTAAGGRTGNQQTAGVGSNAKLSSQQSSQAWSQTQSQRQAQSQAQSQGRDGIREGNWQEEEGRGRAERTGATTSHAARIGGSSIPRLTQALRDARKTSSQGGGAGRGSSTSTSGSSKLQGWGRFAPGFPADSPSANPLEAARGVIASALGAVVTGLLDVMVTEEQVTDDPFLDSETNWGPMDSHLYAWNGPNPLFKPVNRRAGALGDSGHHWFEGDGMLHAVVVHEGGQLSYRNRLVETAALAFEKARGRPLFWSSFNADTPALIAGLALNLARFGELAKLTANVNVMVHHGKVLALHEADKPYEVTLPDLETVGMYDFNGQLDTTVTAHPKVDPLTGDLVFFNYSATAPFCTVGVASPDGRILHRTPLDTERATFMHDFAITERYTVLMDLPLTIDPSRLLRGESLVEFEPEGYARVGVMPRFGTAADVRWFDVKRGFAYHVMNGFEDGDEVVVHVTRQIRPLLQPPKGITWGEILPEKVASPHGEMLTHLYEWRLNMATGQVRERQLAEPGFSSEFPRVNEHFVGKKNKSAIVPAQPRFLSPVYGYAAVSDLSFFKTLGLPVYGSLAKFYLPDGWDEGDTRAVQPVRVEQHHFGPMRAAEREAKEAEEEEEKVDEDDGWLVTYVYDQNKGASEFVIVDAKDMTGPPVARVALPQRVPYGLHGNFIPASVYSSA